MTSSTGAPSRLATLRHETMRYSPLISAWSRLVYFASTDIIWHAYGSRWSRSYGHSELHRPRTADSWTGGADRTVLPAAWLPLHRASATNDRARRLVARRLSRSSSMPSETFFVQTALRATMWRFARSPEYWRGTAVSIASGRDVKRANRAKVGLEYPLYAGCPGNDHQPQEPSQVALWRIETAAA